MAHCNGLILTVGMTDEGIVYSLRQLQPRFVAFLCTTTSEPTLDRVLAQFSLRPSAYRKFVVPDQASQIGRLCTEFYSAYRWLIDDCALAPADIACDPTAGRKWMSAGETMVATLVGLRVQYVDVDYVQGTPDPTTMRLVDMGNADDQSGFLKAGIARELFNRHEFAAAAEAFARIHPSQSAWNDLYQGLANLSCALHRWDLFEHYDHPLRVAFTDSLNRLERALGSAPLPPSFSEFVRSVGNLAGAIDELTHAYKPCLLATLDLLQNANRRIKQGRFNDAMARLYRALESLSQHYLLGYGIEASSPNYGLLGTHQQEAIRKRLDGSLPKRISLDHGWLILWELEHPAARELYHLDQRGRLSHRLKGVLDSRNRSIMAHGWQPVREQNIGDMWKRTLELLRKVEGKMALSQLDRFQLLQLPSFWK